MNDLLPLPDFLFFLAISVPTLAIGALLCTAHQWMPWLWHKLRRRSGS